MEIGNIIPHIEALIFASDKPLTAMELTELANSAFGFMDEKLTLEQIQTAIDGIVEKYRSEFYPFEVRESGGGLQFLTKKDYHKTVAQLNGEKFLKRLSTAALETLSIIAYKQPVTKGEIEAIRGVSSDYAIQRLLEKELVIISGRNEKLPGHPLIYATSRTFMDYFGINSPEDLPKLKEIFDENLVNPTAIEGNGTGQQDSAGDESDNAAGDQNELLAVTQNGELTKARLRSDKNDDALRSPRSAVEDENEASGSSAESDDPDDSDDSNESDESNVSNEINSAGSEATYTVHIEDVEYETEEEEIAGDLKEATDNEDFVEVDDIEEDELADSDDDMAEVESNDSDDDLTEVESGDSDDNLTEAESDDSDDDLTEVESGDSDDDLTEAESDDSDNDLTEAESGDSDEDLDEVEGDSPDDEEDTGSADNDEDLKKKAGDQSNGD